MDLFHPVHFIEYYTTSRAHVVREEIDEDSSNVQGREHVAKNCGQVCQRNLSNKKKKALGRRKAKARQCTTAGSYYIDAEEKEFNETLENVRKKLEVYMALQCCVTCERPQGIHLYKAPKDPQEKTRDEQWQGEVFCSHNHKKKRQNR